MIGAMRSLLAVVVLIASCGQVISSELRSDAGDAAAAGAAGASSASGRGGSDSAAGRGGGGADTAGAAGASGAGAGGRGGTGGAGVEDAGMCIGGDGDVIGFAYNVDQACGDAGRCLPTDPSCCYAHCELNGQHFVGCSKDPNVDGGKVICHASCAECP